MALELDKLRCPYCRELLHFNLIAKKELDIPLGYPDTGYVGSVVDRFVGTQCPACKGILMLHMTGKISLLSGARGFGLEDQEIKGFVFPGPEVTAVRPIPAEVPADYAADFREASVVLPFSAKASAALSRRLLQRLLHEELNINKRDLSLEIDELLLNKDLPTYIAKKVDAIRHLGNFAAHPTKSQQTGLVIDVEPGEAEWMLSILESLFDWHFVFPEVERKRTEALNAKLQEHNKPPIKGSTN